jgi:hypothetical protein
LQLKIFVGRLLMAGSVSEAKGFPSVYLSRSYDGRVRMELGW